MSLPKVVAVLAALFDLLIRSCDNSCGFAKGYWSSGGIVWPVGKKLWLWLLVLPKFADALAALLDSLVRGCDCSCDFVEGCTCGNDIVWLICQRLWLSLLASPKVANVTAALFDGDISYECFNKNIWIQNTLIKLIITISYHIEKRNEWISCLCTLLGGVFST